MLDLDEEDLEERLQEHQHHNWKLKVFTECWLKLLGPVDDGQLEYYRCMCDNHMHGFLGKVFNKPDPQDDPCVRMELYLSGQATDYPSTVTMAPPPATLAPPTLQLSTPTHVYTLMAPSDEHSRNYVITVGLFVALAVLWCLVVVLLRTVRKAARAAGYPPRTVSDDVEAGQGVAMVPPTGVDPPPYDAVADDPPPYWSLQGPSVQGHSLRAPAYRQSSASAPSPASSEGDKSSEEVQA